MEKYKLVTNFKFRAASYSTNNELNAIDLYCKNKIVFSRIRILFLKYLLNKKPFLHYEKQYLDEWTWKDKRYLETKEGFINVKYKFFISQKMIEEIMITSTLLNIVE